MKIMPALAEVKKIASEAKYNVLPVSFEMLSDFITPIETMRILKNVSTHCYMLESAQANETWGRYTFLGFDPKLEITCINGEMKIGNLKVITEHPSDYHRQILADYKSPRFDYLPSFTGGLVGYFSYDYLGYSEPGVKCDVEDTENFKDLDLMLFDKVIAFDHLRQKIILIVNMPLADVEVGSYCQTGCRHLLKEACSIPIVYCARSILHRTCSTFQELTWRSQVHPRRHW